MLRKWIQSGATSKPADTTADTSDTNVVQPPRTRTPGKSPAHHSNKKKAASSTADKENGGTMTRHGPSTSTPKQPPLVMRRRSPRGHAEAVNSAGDTDAAGTPAKRARIADAEDESACGSRGSEASGAVAVRAGETSTMLSPLETGTSETAGNSDTGTSDTMTLEQRTMGASWYAVLAGEFEKSYFQQLKRFLEREKAAKKLIFPEEDHIYSWSQHCTLADVRCVIIGQDPYHNHRQAHGLCFSVREGVAIPPSLMNIYKELMADEGLVFRKPVHGCLLGWAKQGVLLLNAVLTVEAHKANSHQGKGWEKLTDRVIAAVNRHCENVVFMLWGKYAEKKGAVVDKKRHCVLTSVHPSPLSAHRGFIGCRHFSKANAYLAEKGKPQIDWSDLSLTE